MRACGRDQREQVGALERIPPGEDQVRGRRTERGEPLDERQPIGRPELGGVRLWCRRGSAVPAREVAGERHLPVDATRRSIEETAVCHPSRSEWLASLRPGSGTTASVTRLL